MPRVSRKQVVDPSCYPDLPGRAADYLQRGQVPDFVKLWPTGLGDNDEWTIAALLRCVAGLHVLPSEVTPANAFSAHKLTPKCMVASKVIAIGGARGVGAMEQPSLSRMPVHP